jgi:uncharacterized membrane protein YfcA
LQHAISTLALPALSLLVLACAVLGPWFGGPSTAVLGTLLVASLLSSIGGFAFSALAGAVLFRLIDDHVQVVQIMTLCSIANQLGMVCAIRQNVAWRALWVYVAGGLAGLPIGVWILLHAERRLYLDVLGMLLLTYSGYILAGPARTYPLRHKAIDALAGCLGGITGGAAALPSPPVMLLCQLRGCDKLTQRAVFQPFILVMQLLSTALIALWRGQAEPHGGFDPAIVLCVPAGLLGTWLGMACFRRLSNRQFAVAVNTLLIASGLSYLL